MEASRHAIKSVRIGLDMQARRAAILLLCAAGFTTAARAQAPKAPIAGSPASRQIPTLNAVVRRVIIDVVVTDAQGQPVTGLGKADFSVEEDQAVQQVRSVDLSVGEAVGASPDLLNLPRNTFANVPMSQESSPPTVLLYDTVNGVNAFGREQFLEFVKEHRQQSPLAIFGLSDKTYLIQGFTESLSPEELEKALRRVAEEGRRKPSMTLDIRVARTLDALKQIGRFLSSMPGRKNLIWYSSGFPENIMPGPLMTFGFFGANPGAPAIDSNLDEKFPPVYWESIREVTDLLSLGRVAVYPVDMRGVVADRTYSAARSGVASPNGHFLLLSHAEDTAEEVALRASMDTIGNDTGGHAFYGTNGLKEAIGQAILNGSTYYSLTYEPTNPKYDGSLRHIKVTLKKPGYNLSYRKTYYADDLNAMAHAEAPESPLTPALELGLPLAHGLFVEAHLDTAGAPIPATPEQMKALSQFEAMRDRANAKAPSSPVMMQQYTISYALFAKQLELPANEAGVRMASLEFGAMAYDEDGLKLTGLDTRVDDPLPPDRYAKIAADGYRVAQTIAVPATATCLRLAVRDVKGNRVGSLEIRLPLAQSREAADREQSLP